MRPRDLALLVSLPLVAAVAAPAVAAPAAAQTHAGGLNHAGGAPIIGFGAAAAVSGDEIFVSRPGEFAAFPMPGSEPGSVHMFRRGADGWVEAAAIPAPSGVYGDGFGEALAVEGDVLVVGRPEGEREPGGRVRLRPRRCDVELLGAAGGSGRDAGGCLRFLRGRGGRRAVRRHRRTGTRRQRLGVRLRPVRHGPDVRRAHRIRRAGGTPVSAPPSAWRATWPSWVRPDRSRSASSRRPRHRRRGPVTSSAAAGPNGMRSPG